MFSLQLKLSILNWVVFQVMRHYFVEFIKKAFHEGNAFVLVRFKFNFNLFMLNNSL